MDEKCKVLNPIKIFISSGCGKGKERYNKIRADLKLRIEKTGMAIVFLFEDSEYASSMPSSQFYLRELDDSNLCIFLIDNADGIFDGVAPEIQRARTTGKKSIYIFCTENSKEPTWSQKQLQGPNGEKYFEISSFDSFSDKGYDSLINDIAKIYRYYCNKWLVDYELDISGNEVVEITSVAEESLKKSLIANIDRTKIHLSKSIFNNHREVEKTSLFDEYCEHFLQVVLGEKTINQFNTSLLLLELEKQQSKDYFTVVQLRWKAITAYFADKLDDCMAYLYEAKVVAENSSVPNWILADLLIDLRNVTKLIANNNSQMKFDSEYQKALNESGEMLFYPVLDRLISSFYEEIDTYHIKDILKSPYTHNLGNNIDKLSDYIASALVVAIFNASLTQVLLIHNRLRSLSLHLCQIYDDWCFRVLVLKYTALTYRRKDMLDTIQTFNEILGKMNANDAMSIYEFSNCAPNTIQRLVAKLAIFENLGYFFSDEEYSKICEEIFREIHRWIASDNVNVFVGDNIFKALQGNISRADNNAIIDICLATLTPKTKRFWDDSVNLVGNMGVEHVEENRIRQIVNRVEELVKNKDDRDNVHSLDRAVIRLRKTAIGFDKEIDVSIEEHWPELYNGVYSLEIYGEQEEIGAQQIEMYLSVIVKQNETQGVGGIYSLYAINPYKIIENIVKANPSTINKELASKVVMELRNTIICERQTPSAKMNACHLAAVLRILRPETAQLCLSIEDMIKQSKNALWTERCDFLESVSGFNVEWAYTLLQLSNGTANLESVLNVCVHMRDASDAEKIEAISLFAYYLSCVDVSNISFEIILTFLSVCLQSYSSKNHSVRYYAISAILHLLTPETAGVISQQLLLSMDFDSLQIKLIILRNVEKVQYVDKETAIGIKQKAKSDTNFIIRQYCKNHMI